MNYLTAFSTERLYIRPLTLEDCADWEVFLADAEATRYLPNFDNLSVRDWARQWINKQLQRYAEGRFGLLALIEKETGAFVGQCGLLTQVVDVQEEMEIGYHLLPAHWKKGYATEAAQAFKKMAFDNQLAVSIISIIDPENHNSQQVALRNGMQAAKTSTFWGMDVIIFGTSQPS